MGRSDRRRTLWDRRRLRVSAAAVALVSSALTLTPQWGTTARSGAASISQCTPSEVQVTVIFDGPGNADGAVFLSDISSRDCALSGQPTLRIHDQAGTELNHTESLYSWAPPLPRPTSPIVLTRGADARDPVLAIVEFDWCGFADGNKQFDIDFGHSIRSFVVRSVVEAPAQAFVSPKCPKPPALKLAVDVVRELGPTGIAGVPRSIRVTPSTRLRNGEKVRVRVTGFSPGAKFWLSECAAAADIRAGLGCAVQLAAEPFGLTSDTGTGSYSFAVESRAASKRLKHEAAMCARQCVLVATAGPGLLVHAPLSFVSH